jgi:hypothetical protein
MKRRPKQSPPGEIPTPSSSDADAIIQVKMWLLSVSPMVWRRVPVPATITLRELHGVIQVAMGWEGIHLYQFHLRAARYGSCELSASSPNVTLAALQFRKGARFLYEYDLNIPWRHEVRIEDRLAPQEAGKAYPVCTGACPPEGVVNLTRRDHRLSNSSPLCGVIRSSKGSWQWGQGWKSISSVRSGLTWRLLLDHVCEAPQCAAAEAAPRAVSGLFRS